MGEEDGSLTEDLRVALGLLLDDVRDEVRQGIRQLFQRVTIPREAPPAVVAPPVDKAFEEAKDVTPSKSKSEASTQS